MPNIKSLALIVSEICPKKNGTRPEVRRVFWTGEKNADFDNFPINSKDISCAKT